MNIFTSYQRNIKINFEAYTIGEKKSSVNHSLWKKKFQHLKKTITKSSKFGTLKCVSELKKFSFNDASVISLK